MICVGSSADPYELNVLKVEEAYSFHEMACQGITINVQSLQFRPVSFGKEWQAVVCD